MCDLAREFFFGSPGKLKNCRVNFVLFHTLLHAGLGIKYSWLNQSSVFKGARKGLIHKYMMWFPTF